jgi:hypothetical protein
MEPKEMSNKVESVLYEVLSEFDDHEDGDMLVDWIVIANVENPDSEKASAYPMIYSNGIMASYRARGLLVTGLEYLKVKEDELD